jgi:hypothetical protein
MDTQPIEVREVRVKIVMVRQNTTIYINFVSSKVRTLVRQSRTQKKLDLHIKPVSIRMQSNHCVPARSLILITKKCNGCDKRIFLGAKGKLDIQALNNRRWQDSNLRPRRELISSQSH